MYKYDHLNMEIVWILAEKLFVYDELNSEQRPAHAYWSEKEILTLRMAFTYTKIQLHNMVHTS